jgi:molecular chaperone HtpG
MAQREFQTEVSQLLQLIIHSLYSHPEIFLRELISNSSDALDKLRHLTLTDEAFKQLVFDPRIDLSLDEENNTLTLADTGIGMNEEDLTSNLGTIARSGTKNFLSQLSGDARKDSNLIGQFGVGFYSAFMVADKIEVVSRKAGEEVAWRWTSDGKTGFEIEPASREVAGTTILLHLNDEGKQYANGWRLKEVVKKYSNHIAFPIFLTYDKSEWNEEEKKSAKIRTTEQVNAASALWRRSKSELKDEDYKELYKSITGDFSDPLVPYEGGGVAGVHDVVLHPGEGAARFVSGGVQGRGEAVCEAGVHPGRQQRVIAAVSAVCAWDYRLRRSAVECEPRVAAAEPCADEHSDGEREEDSFGTEADGDE